MRIISSIFLVRVSGVVLILLNQILLARLMGAKGFGDYTVIVTWIYLLITCSLFGFDASAIKTLRSYVEEQQWNKVKGFLIFSKRIILIISSCCSLVLLFVLLNNSKKYGVTFSEAFFWALVLLPFLAFIYFYNSLTRALRKNRFLFLPARLLIPFLISAASLIYYQLNNQTLKVDAVLFIYLCIAIALFIFVSARFKNQLNQQSSAATGEYEKKAWLSESVPAFVTAVIAFLIQNGGILFISYYFGNARAGIYSVAALIASFVPFVISAPEALFLPRIRELFASGEPGKLQEMISKSGKFILTISLSVAFLIIILGKFILELFGTAFIASYLPLIILTVGQLVIVKSGIYTTILKATGNRQQLLFISILAGLLSITLNFILVPALGMNGAAVSSVVSLTAYNLIMHFSVKKIGSKVDVLIF